jgi:hypothetical protein
MRNRIETGVAIATVAGLVLSGPCAWGADVADQARETAAHLGRVIGAATTCVFIAPPRVAAAEVKIKDLVAQYAAAHPEVTDLQKTYDLGVGEGKTLVPMKKTNCAFVENDLADAERLHELLPAAALPR